MTNTYNNEGKGLIKTSADEEQLEILKGRF
jgi:hypothetical protein